MVLDLRQSEWRQVAQGRSLIAAWSHDGSQLYYQDLLEHYQPISWVQPGSGQVERVVDFASFLDEGVSRCALAGVSSDDSLVILVDRSTTNLYALELNAR